MASLAVRDGAPVAGERHRALLLGCPPESLHAQLRITHAEPREGHMTVAHAMTACAVTAPTNECGSVLVRAGARVAEAESVAAMKYWVVLLTFVACGPSGSHGDCVGADCMDA